jgi:hypothetical protein
LRRRLPGEAWNDWARRNEPDLTMAAIFVAVLSYKLIWGLVQWLT